MTISTSTEPHDGQLKETLPGGEPDELELTSLRQIVVDQLTQIDGLTERIESMVRRETELRTQLQRAQTESTRLREVIRQLEARRNELLSEIGKMQATRVWRLGLVYWRMFALAMRLLRLRPYGQR